MATEPQIVEQVAGQDARDLLLKLAQNIRSRIGAGAVAMTIPSDSAITIAKAIEVTLGQEPN